MVKALFSPKGGIAPEIMKAIGKATSSVKVAAFAFTSKYIGTALKNARKRNVSVQMILDEDYMDKSYSIDEWLAVFGAEIRKIGMKRGIMHNKFIIVDDKILFTGSYNFTNDSENRNYENIVILDLPDIVKPYLDEFTRLWKIGTSK